MIYWLCLKIYANTKIKLFVIRYFFVQVDMLASYHFYVWVTFLLIGCLWSGGHVRVLSFLCLSYVLAYWMSLIRWTCSRLIISMFELRSCLLDVFFQVDMFASSLDSAEAEEPAEEKAKGSQTLDDVRPRVLADALKSCQHEFQVALMIDSSTLQCFFRHQRPCSTR